MITLEDGLAIVRLNAWRSQDKEKRYWLISTTENTPQISHAFDFVVTLKLDGKKYSWYGDSIKECVDKVFKKSLEG